MDRLLEATARAEREHFWFNGFRRFVGPLIEQAAAQRRDLRSLDCGCGTGNNLGLLRAYGHAVGIDLTFSGFDVYDVEPRKVPDLFASRPIVLFGKWRGAARGSIEITGKTGRAPYQASLAVVPEASDVRHAALRHLWARTRIANLSDFGPATPGDV